MSDVKATPEDVRRLAALARVSVSDDDLARFAGEFDAILAYVGKLDELTVPSGAEEVPVVRNVLRKDEDPYASATWTEAITAQFPESENGSLSVKKIISHD